MPLPPQLTLGMVMLVLPVALPSGSQSAGIKERDAPGLQVYSSMLSSTMRLQAGIEAITRCKALGSMLLCAARLHNTVAPRHAHVGTRE